MPQALEQVRFIDRALMCHWGLGICHLSLRVLSPGEYPGPFVILRTACNRDCPDACGILATVEDGRVTRIQGDPEHPVTKGFLCHRTSRFLERQYDPERLKTPLARRPDGTFAAVTWDEALDRIAAKLLAIRAESGPAAILHYRCGGSLGLMKHLTDWFFERFGPVAMKSGDLCSGAGDTAQETDFGHEDSNDLFDLLNSRAIVLWGKNPHVSSMHLLPVLQEARAKGARVVLIDPVRTKSVQFAHEYLQPRPGGDIALGLGVARLLFEEGFVDAQAASMCDHLDELRAQSMSRSVVEWAALADVRPDEVLMVARTLATRPCAILVGWGMQRRRNGCATIRLLDALCAISGNLGVPGGGSSFYFKRRGAFDLSFIRGEAAAPRTIPEPLLGPGILAAKDPPIRAVWVTAGNPVCMLPESRTVAKALESREMTVVVDSFLTDSARCAHFVLPTTTMLEDDDLLGAYGHHWLAEVRPVVSPPDGVKTDLEILRELAPRVGLSAEFAEDAETWKRKMLAKVAPLGASLEDLRRGPVRNPVAPKVLFEGGRVPTASGRVNLVTALDPEPPRTTAERPLLLMPQATEKSQSAQWPSRLQQGPATAIVHPESAPGFRDGDLARVESEIGELTVRLRYDAGQRRDVLLMDKGGWLSAGRAANALIRAQVTDAGGCAVYLDTPVRLLAPAPRA